MGKTQKIKKTARQEKIINFRVSSYRPDVFWWFAALLQVEGRVVKTDCI